MSESGPTLMVYAVVGLAALLGGGSLLVLGAFLWFGPFDFVDLGLDPAMVLAWDGLLCLAFESSRK